MGGSFSYSDTLNLVSGRTVHRRQLSGKQTQQHAGFCGATDLMLPRHCDDFRHKCENTADSSVRWLMCQHARFPVLVAFKVA